MAAPDDQSVVFYLGDKAPREVGLRYGRYLENARLVPVEVNTEDEARIKMVAMERGAGLADRLLLPMIAGLTCVQGKSSILSTMMRRGILSLLEAATELAVSRDAWSVQGSTS